MVVKKSLVAKWLMDGQYIKKVLSSIQYSLSRPWQYYFVWLILFVNVFVRIMVADSDSINVFMMII